MNLLSLMEMQYEASDQPKAYKCKDEIWTKSLTDGQIVKSTIPVFSKI